MKFTRRTFLARTGLTTMSLAFQRRLGYAMAHPAPPKFRTQLNASSLAKFVDPLPLPKIAQAVGHRPDPDNPGAQLPYYRVAMRPFEAKVHRDMKPTRFWGYEAGLPGPTFETRSGQGLLVEWANDLPEKHFLPIDHSIHGAEADKPEVRTVVHLHGAKTPAASDGYPENWYGTGKSAVYHYPNRQDAAMLWYHDHAIGINRLNVFAGLLGAFFVRDEFEDGLNLPRGAYEIPLIIFDRIFDLESQLNYPVSGDAKSPWTPEVFGDAVLLNGKLFPYLEVEPRKYRFRILNGANARFFHLTLMSSQTPSAVNFQQVGCDLGLLPAPVQTSRVSLAPAERADVIVDFGPHAGTKVTLKNDILEIMQFRVSATGEGVPRDGAEPRHHTQDGRDKSTLPQTLRPVPRILESSAVKTRQLSLVEIDDVIQRPVTMLLNNAHWSMPVTENPALDSTEIWSLINTTDDAHPIHLHMVRFQILDRRPFEPSAYWVHGEVKFTGPAIPPDAVEMGWKDTVRADPLMVTRIIIRFEGFPGRYVWHCHILEHEDNEMMRPYDILPK